MRYTSKELAQELHKSLDGLGVSIHGHDRAMMLSKMLDIPKPEAWSLLEGYTFPDKPLLRKISETLEIHL